MKKFQILVDSASDLKNGYIQDENIGFKVIPLIVLTDEKEHIDNDELDVKQMLKDMHEAKRTSSACPSPESFLQEFDKAEHTFIVTITAKLSGCYNSAVVAKNSYSKPENIHVIDSKATSGTEVLIVDKLVKLIKEGKEFNEIVEIIEKFKEKKMLHFILQKFDNLIANGRMSKIAGLIAKTLIIRPICIAEEGEIKVCKKVVGVKNAFAKMIEMIKEKCTHPEEETLIISHCEAEEEALQVKTDIEKVCKFKEIRIMPMRGLCSYYALEKGIIVCN